MHYRTLNEHMCKRIMYVTLVLVPLRLNLMVTHKSWLSVWIPLYKMENGNANHIAIFATTLRLTYIYYSIPFHVLGDGQDNNVIAWWYNIIVATCNKSILSFSRQSTQATTFVLIGKDPCRIQQWFSLNHTKPQFNNLMA